MMNSATIEPVTLSESAGLPMHLKILWRMMRLLVKKENRSVRKQAGLTTGDALFNMLKCLSMGGALGRYRQFCALWRPGGS